MTWEEFVTQCVPDPATLSVEAYAGSGGYGPVYAAPADLAPCVVEEVTRLVRAQTQDADGQEVTSSTTVYGPFGAVAPPGSRITLPSGRVTRVLAVSRLDAHGLPLPEHTELALE